LKDFILETCVVFALQCSAKRSSWACLTALDIHISFVRLDDDDRLALCDLVPFTFEPRHNLALGHGGRKGWHKDLLDRIASLDTLVASSDQRLLLSDFQLATMQRMPGDWCCDLHRVEFACLSKQHQRKKALGRLILTALLATGPLRANSVLPSTVQLKGLLQYSGAQQPMALPVGLRTCSHVARGQSYKANSQGSATACNT